MDCSLRDKFKELLEKQEVVSMVHEDEHWLEVFFKDQEIPFIVTISENEPQVQNIIGKYKVEMSYHIPKDPRYITAKRLSHHSLEKLIRSMLYHYEKHLRHDIAQIKHDYTENTGESVSDSMTSRE